MSAVTQQLICCSLCILIASAFLVKAVDQKLHIEQNVKEDCTDIARDEETLMVFSTLGGGLTAIDPVTSEIRWTIADDPPIKSEQQQNVHIPQYLPDPRDGSIYRLGDMGSLKKLPYTIPELVANAPCRSSDGILYSGKKSDTWFIVDPKTGKREKVMGFGGTRDPANDGEKIGWATSRSIYLGRTQYTVMMYDSLSKNKNVKPWNITFYDYSAHTMAPDITKEYEYIHLTTTSNGNIVTLDRKDGKFLWKKDLTSPVVAVFLLSSEGLLSIPFTTVSEEAFEAILDESKTGNVNTVTLFQSLYVGEHSHGGLYALPSLVDKETPRISTTPPIKLLNGPDTTSDADPNTIYIDDVIKKNIGIVLGHYNVPSDVNLQISPTPPKDESHRGLATIRDLSNTDMKAGYTLLSDNAKTSADIGVQTEASVELKIESPSSTLPTNALNKTKRIILQNSDRIQKFFNEWFMDHPSGQVHQMLIVLVLAMLAMFWYMCSTVRELKNQSENGSKTLTGSKGGGSDNSNISAQDLIELGDGQIRVGKISFNSNEVLGKGCDGTFVFKGTFEERSVAVKRLLPGCFTFADREVALLRESDAHENVVRYFCTEQDRQFRYIAVELCAATLQDYTEGDRHVLLREQIEVWEVLWQAAAGLNHLHSLNIVHRDIKPQNVLLSFPDARGIVRVMISDFGLCKKLHLGKASFSRRSGITGTEGWIAPEMVHGERTTTAVDIFSLGCVYYYVLSGGDHAFGDVLKRQANILSHEYNLSHLSDIDMGIESSKYILAKQLIADMIDNDVQRRPPAHCIGNHPIFWNEQKILAFLQDVSDRVEKLQFTAEPLKSLEKNGRIVVLEDWNLHLDPIITEDLRRHRGYMGASVRDLLRALRNKKHHYHELSAEVQNTLGCIPHEFTNYWITKFPHLISHAYHAFSICSNEPIFRTYYDSNYNFSRPDYFDADDALFPSPLIDPKPLQRQNLNNSGGGSPKKLSPRTSEKMQQAKNRKGAYNFRKNAHNEDVNNTNGCGVGLQRNLECKLDDTTTNATDDDNNCGDGGAAGGGGVGVGAVKRDTFANFKFRRNQKSSNRNYNQQQQQQATTHTHTKDNKNVTWSLQD